jgi:hypothetical protein
MRQTAVSKNPPDGGLVAYGLKRNTSAPADLVTGLARALTHVLGIGRPDTSGGYHLDVRPCEFDTLLAAEKLQQDLNSLARLHVGKDRQMPAEGAA